MGIAEDVLTANQTFYRAFSKGDMDAMDALWSSAAPVACSHPGWAVLTGRDTVMASWRSILDSPGRPHITCRDAAAHELGDAAYVTCYEDVGAGVFSPPPISSSLRPGRGAWFTIKPGPRRPWALARRTRRPAWFTDGGGVRSRCPGGCGALSHHRTGVIRGRPANRPLPQTACP
ncbi:MAG: nuclear transport factor 2 family protein [Alphaproteobacteria bacterium]